MWLANELNRARQTRPAAELAHMEDGTSARGENEYSSLPLCAPWGVAWLPPDFAQAVLVDGGAGRVCVGVLAQEAGLQAGELLLFSAGGAKIHLKNNGEVVINGQIFAAEKEG